MKKYIFKIVVTIVIAGFIFSCKNDDFFELQRPPEFPWKSVKDFEMAAAQAYNSAFYGWGGWGGCYGGSLTEDYCLSDVGGFIKGTSEGLNAEQLNLRNFTSPPNGGDYGSSYTAISSINAALDWYYVDTEENPFPAATEADKEKNLKRIVGEMHFMRAYHYYYLVRRFHPAYLLGGANDFSALPYIISVPKSESEILSPKFGTTKEFYDLIVNDLNKAISLLPNKFESGMHASYQFGRANKFAAEALLARVYMIMGKHSGTGKDNALALLDDIVAIGGYQLEINPLDNFTKDKDSYMNESKENIWYAFYADAANMANGFSDLRKSHYTRSFPWNDGGGGRDEHFNYCGWHQYFLSVYMCKRIGWWDADSMLTESALNDKRFQQTYYFFLGRNKYKGEGAPPDSIYDPHPKVDYNTLYVDKYFREKNTPSANMPIIRYAEILLNRSILRFRAGNKQGAADDLNIIRKRAWDSVKAGVEYESSTEYLNAGNITEEKIHCERIKELSGEVEWIPYLQSLQLPITLGDRKENEVVQGMGTVNPPYNKWYWPIDPTELQYFIPSTK